VTFAADNFTIIMHKELQHIRFIDLMNTGQIDRFGSHYDYQQYNPMVELGSAGIQNGAGGLRPSFLMPAPD
jgi:hypothetical protein